MPSGANPQGGDEDLPASDDAGKEEEPKDEPAAATKDEEPKRKGLAALLRAARG